MNLLNIIIIKLMIINYIKTDNKTKLKKILTQNNIYLNTNEFKKFYSKIINYKIIQKVHMNLFIYFKTTDIINKIINLEYDINDKLNLIYDIVKWRLYFLFKMNKELYNKYLKCLKKKIERKSLQEILKINMRNDIEEKIISLYDEYIIENKLNQNYWVKLIKYIFWINNNIKKVTKINYHSQLENIRYQGINPLVNKLKVYNINTKNNNIKKMYEIILNVLYYITIDEKNYIIRQSLFLFFKNKHNKDLWKNYKNIFTIANQINNNEIKIMIENYILYKLIEKYDQNYYDTFIYILKNFIKDSNLFDDYNTKNILENLIKELEKTDFKKDKIINKNKVTEIYNTLPIAFLNFIKQESNPDVLNQYGIEKVKFYKIQKNLPVYCKC